MKGVYLFGLWNYSQIRKRLHYLFKRLSLLQIDYVTAFSLITRQGAAHQATHFTDTSRLFINIDFKQARMRLYCRYFV